MPFAAKRMDLETVILGEVSHNEGEIVYDIPCMETGNMYVNKMK